MNMIRTIVSNLQRLLKSNPVLFVAGLVIGSVVTGTLLAGSLDPPPAAVDGFGDPLATGATPPSWDKILDSTNGDPTAGRVGCDSDRFTCVMNDNAVRDNETGLVWERAPDNIQLRDWTSAIEQCATRTIGGRKGWHLPMREQLASLVDPSNSQPALPSSHPFVSLPPFFWSATTNTDTPTEAWRVFISSGAVFASNKAGAPGSFVWCVRGGQSFDGQDNQAVIDALTPAP